MTFITTLLTANLPIPCEAIPVPAVHLPRVLLAEGDHELRSLIGHAMRRNGYDVVECRCREDLDSLRETMQAVNQTADFDLVICDATLIDDSCCDVVQQLRRGSRRAPLILIDPRHNAEAYDLVLTLQPARVIDQPFDVRTNLRAIRRIVSL